MFSSFSSYKYLPLKPASRPDGEFRILTLLPGPKGSKLEATLQHVSFASHPPYEALSYTWGNPKGPRSLIPVKGNPEETFEIKLKGKRKHVTYNLKEALDQIRDEARSVKIWVDALCINQENKSERSEQVKSMAKIYGQASRVLVWLGETDLYVDKAFDTLEELCWATKVRILQYCAQKLRVPWFQVSDDAVASLILAELESSRWLDSPFHSLTSPESMSSFQRALSLTSMDFSKSTDPTELTAERFPGSGMLAQYLVSGHDRLAESPDFLDRVKAVGEVFECRSYWTRIWIIQEIFNGANVVLVCGERLVDFSMISLIQLALSRYYANRACHLFGNGDENSVGKLKMTLINPLMFHISIYWRPKSKGKDTLAHSLLLYSGRSCSDGRDRIYALINISQPINISIDYSKTVTDVWIDSTRSIISHERNLNILCARAQSQNLTNIRTFDKLPSWVPNYRETILTTGNLCDLNEPNDEQLYQGGGAFPNPHGLQVRDNRVLQIHGRSLGCIKAVGAQLFPWNWGEDPTGFIIWLMRDHVSAANGLPFWRALVMDAYRDASNLRRRLGTSESAEANLASDVKEVLASKAPPRLFRRLRDTLQYKSLCKTTNDGIALVLGDPQVGDHIFFAREATCPFILRPTIEDQSYQHAKQALKIPTFYHFVGGAYVHGRMDGEPLREIGTDGIEEETLFLI